MQISWLDWLILEELFKTQIYVTQISSFSVAVHTWRYHSLGAQHSPKSRQLGVACDEADQESRPLILDLIPVLGAREGESTVVTYPVRDPRSRIIIFGRFFLSQWTNFSRFTHSPWLRVLKVLAGFACRILAVGWQGTQDILIVQFRILSSIFSVIRATARVTGPLLARRSVLLIQFVGAWDWVLGLAVFWSSHRHGVREQGCHHHPLL